MWKWHTKLMTRIEAEVAALTKAEAKLRTVVPLDVKSLSDHFHFCAAYARLHLRLSPFLSLIKPEKLSLITILEIMHLQGSGGVSDGMKTARALIHVGRAVEIEHKAQMCKKNNISIPPPAHPRDSSIFTNIGYRALQERRVAACKIVEESEEWTADWTQTVRVRVGSFLVDALMDVATVTHTGKNKKTGEEL